MRVVCGFVLALGLIACSSGGPGVITAGRPVASNFTGYANGVYYQNGVPTIVASPTVAASVTPTASGTATPERKWPDFVRVKLYTIELGWGSADCPSLRRGNKGCRAPFHGDVLLGAAQRGKIVLLAFENGLEVPAAKRVLAPIYEGRTVLCAVEGCAFGGAWLPYTPTPAARSVRFKAELQDEKGKVLAYDWTDQYVVR